MDRLHSARVFVLFAFALSTACASVQPAAAGNSTATGTVYPSRTPSRIPIPTHTPTATITSSLSPTLPLPAYRYLTLPGPDGLREIFREGQRRGMRSGIFSKVGDSLTANAVFLVPFGKGDYSLGEYDYLRDVIAFFSRENARESNSFANESLAARSGWRAEDVLDPSKAGSICQTGEFPLSCEYRIVRPSIAVILLGTNDAMAPTGTIRISMRRIVVFTLNQGVIPILTTLPPMIGKDVEPYNSVIRELAGVWKIPWIDLNAALASLPNQGLTPDGVHLSWIDPADFRPPNLKYGMTVRNLLTLQALDAVWKSLPPEDG